MIDANTKRQMNPEVPYDLQFIRAKEAGFHLCFVTGRRRSTQGLCSACTAMCSACLEMLTAYSPWYPRQIHTSVSARVCSKTRRSQWLAARLKTKRWW